MIILLVGSIHFQPELEIEKVEQIVRLKPDEDPDEIGEKYLALGYHSYLAVEANGNHMQHLPGALE